MGLTTSSPHNANPTTPTLLLLGPHHSGKTTILRHIQIKYNNITHPADLEAVGKLIKNYMIERLSELHELVLDYLEEHPEQAQAALKDIVYPINECEPEEEEPQISDVKFGTEELVEDIIYDEVRNREFQPQNKPKKQNHRTPVGRGNRPMREKTRERSIHESYTKRDKPSTTTNNEIVIEQDLVKETSSSPTDDIKNKDTSLLPPNEPEWFLENIPPWYNVLKKISKSHKITKKDSLDLEGFFLGNFMNELFKSKASETTLTKKDIQLVIGMAPRFKSFLPTYQDILQIQWYTSGTFESLVRCTKTKQPAGNDVLRILDNGGLFHERSSWIKFHSPEYENQKLLFVVSLESFANQMYEDPDKNQMIDSISYYNEIMNNPMVTQLPKILIFTKADWFEKKFSENFDEFLKIFPDFTGTCDEWKAAIDYIVSVFKELYPVKEVIQVNVLDLESTQIKQICEDFF